MSDWKPGDDVDAPCEHSSDGASSGEVACPEPCYSCLRERAVALPTELVRACKASLENFNRAEQAEADYFAYKEQTRIELEHVREERDAASAELAAARAETARAVEAERERCAQVAEASYASQNLADRSPRHVAAVLRAPAQPAGEVRCNACRACPDGNDGEGDRVFTAEATDADRT